MLALTDQALAKLVIAATAVPCRSRARWLQEIARQIESAPQRAANARRARACRQRQRAGLRIYRLLIDDATMEGVLSALVSYGRLSEANTLRPEAVERALADIIKDVGKRFCGGCNA